MINVNRTNYSPQRQSFGIGNTHTLGVKREVRKLALDPSISNQGKAEIGFFLDKLSEFMKQYPASHLKEFDYRELARSFKEAAGIGPRAES